MLKRISCWLIVPIAILITSKLSELPTLIAKKILVDLTGKKCSNPLQWPLFCGVSTKPVSSCKFCRNVTKVTKLRGLSLENYKNTYANTGIPAIIKGVAKDWAVVGNFSLEYLASIYQGQLPNDCEFLNLGAPFSNINDFLCANDYWSNTSNDCYIGWKVCSGDVFSKVRSQFESPEFQPNTSGKSVMWLFAGMPFTGVYTHVDMVKYESWQVQLRGSKRWKISPPIECLYECGYKQISFEMEPVDILLLDNWIWYHSTMALGNVLNMAMTIDFPSKSPPFEMIL